MSSPGKHNVLTAALRYAAHGIHVFPVNVSIVVVDGKKKKNCSPIHDWRTVSTTSESTIRTWWSTVWAGASVAIDCGKSNLVVVDPDGAEGIANWAALAPLGIPATWRAATPGGGEHWYYAEHPNRVVGIDSAGKVARKVDVRGLGGFVIAPPSTDARGVYRWLEGEPEWGHLPTVPDLVIEAMNGKKATPTTTAPASAQAASRHFSMEQAEKYIEPALAQLRSAPDGTINATLNNAAITVGHFVPEFFSRMQAEKLLLDALAFTVYDAKTWKAEATIESGISAADWKATRVDTAPQHELLDDICPGWRTDVATGEPQPKTSTVDVDGLGADLSDSIMSHAFARDVLEGQFVWARGLGWLAWNTQRWQESGDEEVLELARQWAIYRFAQVARTGNPDLIAMWRPILSLGKQRAALTFAKGLVQRRVADFDANPDLLNTPAGVVDLRTGQVMPHDATLLMTKITSGSYRPGYTHPDWEAALQALPDDETRRWLQARIGQGATGHRCPDGVNVIMQGGGENGKGALVSDGAVPALGDYAAPASYKLIADTREHSEEQATLRGKRLIVAEELVEDQVLNVAAIKRISDVSAITARHVHQKNMTFKTTHTLLATSNYVPIVKEVDHGTWRRLVLLIFPYRYRKPHEKLECDTDRPGDPGLKHRIEYNVSGQHDAAVTWLVDGAIRWYADGALALRPSAWVARATDTWRANADRILGFWRANLSPDRDACILAEELFDNFNLWLRGNGHHSWSRQTFVARFKNHEETSRSGVEERRVRNPVNVSRAPTGPGETSRALRPQESIWQGLRFRTASDQCSEEQRELIHEILGTASDQCKHGCRASCADPKATFPRDPHAGKVGTGSAQLARSISAPSADASTSMRAGSAQQAQPTLLDECPSMRAGSAQPPSAGPGYCQSCGLDNPRHTSSCPTRKATDPSRRSPAT